MTIQYSELDELLMEVRSALSVGMDSSLRYVPAWRYELEWRLYAALSYLVPQREYLDALVGDSSTDLEGLNITLKELPVDEMIRFGISRPVLTDEQLARLALSASTIRQFWSAFLDAAEESRGEIWHRVFNTFNRENSNPNAPFNKAIASLALPNESSPFIVSDLQGEQIVQAFAIRKDRELVPFQDTRFFAQVRKQTPLLESLYRDMENCPTAQSTTEFTKLYIRFHSVLAAVGPHQPVVEQACEFIRNHESQHPLTEQRKTRVLAEHRRLLDAILAGDTFGASGAMIGHLTNSEQRWLPEFHDSLSEGNAGFFREMHEDSFLCVSSVNVLPIESEAGEWASLGMAAADAVARGATLLYLTPAPEILRKLLGASDVSIPWQNELQVDFEDFIERISGHIQSVSPCRFVSQDDALSYVRSRVLLLTLFDDALFVRTQPDRTCGYFWFEPGSELLTERKPLLNDVTHRKIERINDLNNFENFKEYLAEALVMTRSRLQADQESLLQRLDHVLSCLGAARHHKLDPATTHG